MAKKAEPSIRTPNPPARSLNEHLIILQRLSSLLWLVMQIAFPFVCCRSVPPPTRAFEMFLYSLKKPKKS